MTTHILTPTSNLEDSVVFYTFLGFQLISEKNPTVVTDGKAVVEIDPNRFIRAGIKVYTNKLDEYVTELKKLTQVVAIENGYVLSDPTGTYIYLTNQPVPVDYDVKENSFSSLGNYAGISLEAIDPELTIKVWKVLGFKTSSGSLEQGWVALTNNEGFGVSIMKPNQCPHLFFNPSLTYFNGGNNPEVIEKVREAQIPITEEITHFNSEGIVDNIIIRDPGGYGFFLFND